MVDYLTTGTYICTCVYACFIATYKVCVILHYSKLSMKNSLNNLFNKTLLHFFLSLKNKENKIHEFK